MTVFLVRSLPQNLAIAWLFVRDITDLSWEIRRERSRKLQVIKSAQIDVVSEFLTLPWPHTDELKFGPKVYPDARK